MPRCLQDLDCLAGSSSQLEIQFWAPHGLKAKGCRQTVLSSFLSDPDDKPQIPGVDVLNTRVVKAKGASKEKTGFFFSAFSEKSEKGEGPGYCCKGLKNVETPCDGFRVERKCMAEMLDPGAPGFGEKVVKKAEKFEESSKSTFCCKQGDCGFFSSGIEVPNRKLSGDAKAGMQNDERLTTADIVENPEDCNFSVYPEFHGCRARGVDGQAKNFKATGKNFRVCVTPPRLPGDDEEVSESERLFIEKSQKDIGADEDIEPDKSHKDNGEDIQADKSPKDSVENGEPDKSQKKDD